MGRYCHVCGQENIVTHQSFAALAKHFIYDMLHFDGSFYHTLLYLFTRPGRVAREYAEGKRKRYLDPVRMYLFTSALFFLIFFSFSHININGSGAKSTLSTADRQALAAIYQNRLKENPTNSVLQYRLHILQDTSLPVSSGTAGLWESGIMLTDKQYGSLQQYDSVQAALPVAQKDGWIKRNFMRQTLRIQEKYGEARKAQQVYIEYFLHKLPYLLFISLPFFALILKGLYRRQRNLYYSDHAIFTLYHYILSFILILLIFAVARLKDWTGWGIFGILETALYLAWPVYLFLEMKNFYRQSRGKTLGKFLLLNTGALLVLCILFMAFLILSVFQI